MAGITPKKATSVLGEALAKAREKTGISQRALAKKIGWDQSMISRIESGQRSLNTDEAAILVEALELVDDEAADFMAVAGASDGGKWLAVTLSERRAQLAALLAAERTATRVTHVATLLPPGVLQTSDVIRTIMVEGGVPADEIDERVAVRIGRREMITRRNPAYLEVLLDEAALRRPIGGPKVWADQLRYLNEMVDLPNVEIRVIPFDAGWNDSLSGAFIYIEGDGVPPIINIELRRGGVILQHPDDIAEHRRDAEAVRKKAKSPEATRELIAEIITELENPK